MKQLFAFLCATLLFVSCGKDDPTPTPTTAKRTVIVYMSAENNLSSFADMDTTEMIAASKTLGKDCNYIAFLDKATPTETPTIWKYAEGKKELVKQFETDFYNSDPEKIYEVLEWIKQKYPANSYGLVLWGHATGWEIEGDTVPLAANSDLRRAFGRDTGDNTKSADNLGKWINIPTLAKVLAHLSFKFDYIFCDCCNMSNAESIYELRNVTNYIIASPAEIPARGAPYDKLTTYLFDTSGSTTAYQKIIDTYADDTDSRLPLVLTKTSEMEQLANATRVILQPLEPTAEKVMNLNGLMYYDGEIICALRVLYDMNDFLKQNASADEYAQWKQAFDCTVIYKRFAETWQTNGHVNFKDFTASEEKYGGLSMYVPRKFYNNYSYSRHYNSTYCQMQWYWTTQWNNYGW